jgi:hypothetical protein
MPTLILFSTFVPSLVCIGLPDQPVQKVQEAVVDSYGKVNNYSVSCFIYVGDIHASPLCMGSIEYRFDRSAKQLAAGTRGEPELLVKDGQLFLLVCHENDRENPTYLEVRKSHAITWKDIDEARQLIRKECPLARGSMCIPCYVWPFLDGGAERLFPANATVVTQNDMKPAEVSSKQSESFSGIFRFGHPDLKRIIGANEEDFVKLDPKKYPVCIKSEDGPSSWVFAFERETGNLTAAIGVVDRQQVLGIPGNELSIITKKTVSFVEGKNAEGEFKPLPLQLPQGARTVGAAGLKAAYYAAMLRTGRSALVERKDRAEEDLRATIKKETQLNARIAALSPRAAKEPKELDDLQRELDGVRGDKAMYSYVKTQLQVIVDELRREEGKQPPQ